MKGECNGRRRVGGTGGGRQLLRCTAGSDHGSGAAAARLSPLRAWEREEFGTGLRSVKELSRAVILSQKGVCAQECVCRVRISTALPAVGSRVKAGPWGGMLP